MLAALLLAFREGLDAALENGGWALFTLGFVAVLREGIELALFLTAAAFTATAGATLVGGLIGLLVYCSLLNRPFCLLITRSDGAVSMGKAVVYWPRQQGFRNCFFFLREPGGPHPPAPNIPGG